MSWREQLAKGAQSLAGVPGAAVLAFALAGCAVLTVEVDVYKGPMANHADVQLEQTAVLAMGAKPLLIQLRDSLENAKRRSASGLGLLEKTIEKEKDYKTGYIDREPGFFLSSDARTLNDILELYVDRSNLAGTLRMLSRRIDSEWREFQLEVRELYPTDGNIKTIWGEFEQFSSSLPVQPRAGLLEATRDLLLEARSFSRFRALLGALKTPGSDSNSVAGLRTRSVDSLSPQEKIDLVANDEQASVNEIHFLLEDPAIESRYAELLLPSDPNDVLTEAIEENRRRFVVELQEIARAYRVSRSLLESVFLDLLTVVELANYDDVAESRYAELCQGMLLEIAKSWYVYGALELADNGEALWLRGALQGAAPNLFVAGVTYDAQMSASLRRALESLMFAQPVRTARALRATHEFFKSSEFGVKLLALSRQDREFGEYVARDSFRRYGLTRPPYVFDPDKNDPKEQLKTRELLARSAPSGGSLGGGRPPYGIETAIEQYIEVMQGLRYERHEDLSRSRRLPGEAFDLLVSLIHFGEKVRYIAYYTDLVRHKSEESESLLALQAVGNTIISQVDELWNHSDFEERAESFLEIHQQALLAAQPEFTEVLAAIQKQLDAQVAEHEAYRKIGTDGTALKAYVAAAPLKKVALSDSATEVRQLLEAHLVAHITGGSPGSPNETESRALLDWLKTEEVQKELRGTVVPADVPALKAEWDAAINRRISSADHPKSDEQALVAAKGVLTEQSRGISGDIAAKLTGLNARLAELRRSDRTKEAACKLLEKLVGEQLNAVRLETRIHPNARTARDAIDQLVATLQYELAYEVKARGKDSAHARDIRESIRTLYEQRAGMAYLRPAGAFLRSSYPVTAFQQGHDQNWSNMLQDQLFKSVPLIGESLVAEGTVKERKVAKSIDKQFWQNINRVRVSGTGRTNTAIVKDDVGNWYVKGYSGNPEDVVKTAGSLVRYNLSKETGINAFDRAGDSESEEEGEAGEGSNPDQPTVASATASTQTNDPSTLRSIDDHWVERMLEEYQDIKRFAATTDSALEQAWDGLHAGLKTEFEALRLGDAWESLIDEQKFDLDEQLEKYREAREDGKADSWEGLETYATIDAYRVGLSFLRKVKRKAEAGDPGIPAAKWAEAAEEADRLLGAPLLERVRDHRKRLVDRQGVLEALSE